MNGNNWTELECYKSTVEIESSVVYARRSGIYANRQRPTMQIKCEYARAMLLFNVPRVCNNIKYYGGKYTLKMRNEECVNIRNHAPRRWVDPK